MPFSRSSQRAVSARRVLAGELERLVGEHLRGSFTHLEDALAALADGEGLPPGLTPEMLFGEVDRLPRVRPVLVHLAAQTAAHTAAHRDADPQAAVDVAYVAEMFQGAIKLHDAALGRQDGRRRRAARRVLKGASSWLGGNHLVLRALEIARRAPAPEILGDALDTLREVSEGQALGASLTGRAATPAEAVQHAAARHGAVFAFSCRAGGHLARAERPVVTRLGRYGRHVGTAWQLAEDLAAFEPAEGADPWRLLHRQADAERPIYPVSVASTLDPGVRERWEEFGRTADPALAAELAAQVREAGALRATREALAGQVWSARLALRPVPPSPARDALDRIAASLALAA